jgi:dihydroorotase-like cyclic amidohydrolase
MYDLVIQNGRVVVPGVGVMSCGVGVADGKVAALGAVDAQSARQTIDARGHHIFPGVVDPHVHFGNQLSFEEECLTETRAAVLGGVTTVGVMLLNFGDPYDQYMDMVQATVARNAFTDVFVHAGIFNPQQADAIPEYANAYGVRSFKFFMSGFPGICPAVDDAVLFRGFQQVAQVGPDAVACVHAENGPLVAAARSELERTVPNGGLAEWMLAHPPLAEEMAISTAERLARAAGVPLYVVHISSSDGLARAAALKAQGSRIYLETTSPYLSVTTNDDIGLLAKMVPPVRDPATRAALWDGVVSRAIDVIGTDNTARSSAGKAPEKGLHGAGVGLPVIGTHLAAVLHFGHHERGVPLERLAECVAQRPAQIFGVYPQKGTISIGADADLTIVDTSLKRVVDPSELGSYADFTPLQGHELTGWPVATIKAGEVLVEGHKLLAEQGRGQYLARRADMGAGVAAR